MNSSTKTLTAAVLCSSQESLSLWRKLSLLYKDLAIEPIYPVCQAWRVVKSLIAQSDAPTIVCQDFVRFGVGFKALVDALIQELDQKYARWGICGNRGCSADGLTTYNYTRYAQEPGGIQTALGPRAVLTLDDNLVLLNCAQLQKLDLPDLGRLQSLIFGVPLSLECLRYKLPVLADPRLFALRKAQHSAVDVQILASSLEFQNYYSQHFINHVVPWPDASLDMQACINYDYVARPEKQPTQSDILNLFDHTLPFSRERLPTLTLCCRTQFKRPELLHRALASFAMAMSEVENSIDFHVRLISDCPPDVSERYLQAVGREFPTLDLECWHHIVRSPRYSRTDLLIGAIERAKTDYIWFVDDDDYILPGAIQSLSRVLVVNQPVIIVANSIRVDEVWSVNEIAADANQARYLKESRFHSRFEARHIFRVLTGANFIPVCNMILPVQLMNERLFEKRAIGDYNEDYFFLLAALTSKQVEIQLLNTDICGVSYRGAENTVNEVDRLNWDLSYATFMQELLSEDNRNPALWQFGNYKIA